MSFVINKIIFSIKDKLAKQIMCHLTADGWREHIVFWK